MKEDISHSPLFREAEELYRRLRKPGTGMPSDAVELRPAPNGRRAVFTGTCMAAMEGSTTGSVFEVDLETGALKRLTGNDENARLASISPTGNQLAFISDREEKGDFQLYLSNRDGSDARRVSNCDGWVEYYHWSPAGTHILIGVAGKGADIAGGQGAVASERADAEFPEWMPEIDRGEEEWQWRSLWVFDVAGEHLKKLPWTGRNIWEATWCGDQAVAAILSDSPSEGRWYSATLELFELANGQSTLLYAPDPQMGWPAANPSGSNLAFVEASASDRLFVAGELRLVDIHRREVRSVPTAEIDITHCQWIDDNRLLITGHRGFETVAALVDAATDNVAILWASEDITTSGNFASVSVLGRDADFLLIGEGLRRGPEIAIVSGGEYRTILALHREYEELSACIAAIDRLTWKAPDGLEIQGYLLRPEGAGPHPTVMSVHGGPVWHWHGGWLGRRSASVLMMLRHGIAVFMPNPRGSTGRGQSFIREVIGDLGGADTHDYLTGLDMLVARGFANPARLGVTGVSYGGFMTSWLVTQDPRFAAAVAVSPVTNQVTQHLLSNIPEFVSLYLNDDMSNRGGRYFERSPVLHVRGCTTPVLNIAGALDRCTPPEEAIQFHKALRETGTTSELLIYPKEGHGVRTFPAAIDYAARLVSWFLKHLR